MPRRQPDPFETRDVKEIIDPEQKAVTETARVLLEEGMPEDKAYSLAQQIVQEIEYAMSAQPVAAHLRKAIRLLAIEYPEDDWEAFDQWSQLVTQITSEALETLLGPFEQITDLDADYRFLVDKHGVPDKMSKSQGTAIARAAQAYVELMHLLKEV